MEWGLLYKKRSPVRCCPQIGWLQEAGERGKLDDSRIETQSLRLLRVVENKATVHA
jgi:hypothetical protein